MTALDRTRLTGPSRSMFGTDGAPRKRMLSGRAFLLLGRGTVFGSPQNIFTANRAYGRIKWRHEHRFVATKNRRAKSLRFFDAISYQSNRWFHLYEHITFHVRDIAPAGIRHIRHGHKIIFDCYSPFPAPGIC